MMRASSAARRTRECEIARDLEEEIGEKENAAPRKGGCREIEIAPHRRAGSQRDAIEIGDEITKHEKGYSRQVTLLIVWIHVA